MEYHKIYTTASMSGKDHNYNIRDSHKGKETSKSTPSIQRKPNQTNNLQKAVEPESHASLFNHALVIRVESVSR